VRKILSHKELDRHLDPLSEDQESYDEGLMTFVRSTQDQRLDLEISDPITWRKAPSATKSSFVEQFRSDVDSILLINREEEARLARRVEFARRRLELAQIETGLDPEGSDAGRLARGHLGLVGPEANPAARCVPPRVERRALELHALRTEMVERNLYLVLINVERYAQKGTSRLDLIQEGCVSLYRAVDGFDWRRGLLFRTYAVHWLNQAFRNFLYNSTHTVRVPVYLQKALKHINQATIRLGNPNASPGEIAADSEMNENLVTAAIRAARGSFSIDSEYGESNDGSRLRDLIVDDEGDPYSSRIEEITLEEGLERALSSLLERERKVVCMRFGIGYQREHTLAEVAGVLGVSVERVRQIQVRAVSKLNTPGLRRDMDPFLN
jgi:RNA polymerase primary sigma factor